MTPPQGTLRQAARGAGRLARAAGASQVKWRILALILIPLSFWLNASLYRYVPETAAGFAYEVRINRITGSTCIVFEAQPAPENLIGLRCR
jgi:hypothetical protein